MLDTKKLLSKLTLSQKATLCAGADAWQTVSFPELGIPSVIMTDGPHGLRKQYDVKSAAAVLVSSIPATCFPSAATTACSFDPALAEEIGRALGEEARDQNVQLVLGPGINIKRSPLCGRNFEYFSEDPLLAGAFGTAMIRGIQSRGTGACLKHFAANNREYFRMVSNSILDERALHEIYLPGFEMAVKEGRPYAVMSAYNLVNGHYCGEDPGLIQGILRDDWGFDGLVISDWGACYNRVHGIRAGMDLEMPYSGAEHHEQIVKAVENEKLSEEELDTCAGRVLHFVDRCLEDKETPYECDYVAHHDLARKAAEQSAVLLKNEGALLPLPKNQPFALIGAFAEEPRYQGAGSSQITPKDLEIPRDIFNRYGFQFEYAPGYVIEARGPVDEDDLVEVAVRTAKRAGLAVIFAGLPPTWEFEGVDRDHLNLPPAQNRLIEQVATAVPTVVLLQCGAPVVMPWADKVQAILHLYLGGEAGASAAARLLDGTVSPCGKLAETYPLSLDDTPARHFYHDNRHNTEYRESVYVGYRYYEAAKKNVLFPFGFGLSYTSFDLKNIEICEDGGGALARLTVTNTGSREGAEVVQVYTKGASRSYRQLAGFTKVFLKPGESRNISIPVPERAFCFYHNGWKKEDCDVLVGTSSLDTAASRRLEFTGSMPCPEYPVSRDGHWDQDAFHGLFPGAVPQFIVVERPFTLNATLVDLKAAPTGQFINSVVKKFAGNFFPANSSPEFQRVMMRYLDENPFRALVSLSGGAFPYGIASALLMIANGNYLMGLTRLAVEGGRMILRKKRGHVV